MTCSWHGSGLNNVCASHVLFIVKHTHDSRRVFFLSPRPFYSVYGVHKQPHAQTPNRARRRNRANVRTAILRFPDSTPNAVWYVLTVALLLGLIADYHLPYQRHRNYFPYLHTNHGNTCRKECWSMLSAFCHA